MPKRINENNLSYLTGALAFLIFSTYFVSIVLYGRTGVSEPFIIFGILVFFCLVTIYLKKKYPVKKVVIAIGVGFCFSLLVLVMTVLIGTSLVNDLSPSPSGTFPTPKPTPVPAIIPITALGVCAVAAAFFRRSL
ncbi:MAG: hypothetical protein NTZ39_02045 [Methanoregula sp.]|nr:hypothetical protein [Methanoregula sp.]